MKLTGPRASQAMISTLLILKSLILNQSKVPLELKLQRYVGERSYVPSIGGEGRGENTVPRLLKEHSYYEALIWWFTMHQIGPGLRERYRVPTELPPKLVTLVKKLEDRDVDCWEVGFGANAASVRIK